jgi:hypothetical protein
MKDERFSRPGDYRNVSHESALWAIKQQLIWDGVRNPIYALNSCPTMFPWNGISAEEARKAVDVSQKAYDRLISFVDAEAAIPRGNWTRVHQLGHEHEGWHGRSRVRKTYFESWYDDVAILLFDDGIVARLNGIAGACKERL